MPLPPCFHLSADVFPRVRAEAARRLVGRGWTQTQVAQALGISQGMVSKHLAAATAPDAAPPGPLVARLTDDLLADLEAGTAHGPSAWCRTLTVGQDRAGGEVALADLLAAERTLREAAPLALMPQIGLNVARALPDAATPDDVLSFPGRLIDAGGVLLTPAPPAFGASGHLARCLLHLRARDPALLALANVRGGPDAVRRARRLGWKVVEIPAAHGSDREAAFREAVDRQRAAPVLLHDGQAPGIEPCLYVAGTDAGAVAQRILDLERSDGQGRE